MQQVVLKEQHKQYITQHWTAKLYNAQECISL